MKKFGIKSMKCCGCGKFTCEICNPFTEFRISKTARWTSNFVPPTQWCPEYDKFWINRFLVRN